MKQQILFDNIIYSLQKSGGISSTWALLQKAMLNDYDYDYKFIEYKNAIKNIFRNSLELQPQCIISPNSILPVAINRYRKVKTPIIDESSIFHSSYYRSNTNKNIKSVVTVHDFIYERYTTGISKTIHCRQKYSAINNADSIICVSQNTRKDLIHYIPGINKSKITVIYNGVSSDFCPIDDIQRSNRLLYVGSRSKYKNFELLIETIADTSYNLDICGTPLSQSEQKFLNKKIGANRYNVFSNIDNNSLNKIYNSALCLIYPSNYEGFGLPIIEAQQAGCPVIALNSSSIPEIIGETPLLMKFADKKSLLSTIKLLNSPSIIKEVIDSGKKNSLRFSAQSMTNAYKDIYNTLI